jgi:hypothetical protein
MVDSTLIEQAIENSGTPISTLIALYLLYRTDQLDKKIQTLQSRISMLCSIIGEKVDE